MDKELTLSVLCEKIDQLRREYRWTELSAFIESIDTNQISDGYHTFGELYEHRIQLWITLCRVLARLKQPVWRSRLHSDGSSFEGWFVLGLGGNIEGNTLRPEQITYHLPNRFWPVTEFAHTLDRAPEFDWHTPQDVLFRLTAI